ncbi:MAG: 5-oxoprolinase subunit PxpA [Bacteroidetes bacterium]|nr:5-oxoprolinase subunit PxpA [Bacteroidota bacterium]
MNWEIDLNCDMGEGIGNDALIIPYVSSISIACGGHAGNKDSIRQAIRLAKQAAVCIGAHPSYPDRENFGRNKIVIDYASLKESLINQLTLIQKIAFEENYPLVHLKPHGALYNQAAVDIELADLIVSISKSMDPQWSVWGLPNSALAKSCTAQSVCFIPEGFADRSYQADGSLTPRTDSQALLETEEACVKQVLQLVTQKKVTTLNGEEIDCNVATICLHGDGAHALSFAKALRGEFKKRQISCQPPYGKTSS